MTIRPATLADLPSILSLERACATAAHWTEEQYRLAFQGGSSGRLVLVAPASLGALPAPGNLAGFLVARHLSPEWELENLVVAPDSRRNGLGKRLLDALLAAASETNSSSVFLEVRESNAAARALYQKAGFEPTGRRNGYYTNPLEDAVLYSRTLL